MSNRKLFEAFPPVSSERWKEQIITDLKGVDFDKKLVWKTIEGFDVQPYYRSEDLEKNSLCQLEPNTFPFIRGQKTENNDWLIRQDFEIHDIDETNKSILDVLMKGVTSINIIIKKQQLNSQSDFDRLMRGIELTAVELNFCSSDSYADLMSMLSNFIEKNKIDAHQISGSFNIDPLSKYTTKGKCNHKDINEAYGRISKLIQFAHDKLPNFHVVAVNGITFPDAGSSVTQELGFSLAMANEYLSVFSDSFDIDTISNHLRFNVGISSNYFMEIAKVRALRYLWSKLVEAYGPKNIDSAKTFIHASNSSWNKTVYDPYVNMLRVTTESMSSVIGGVDSLTVQSFNASFDKHSAFSDRISRNTQIILKEEAYLGKVVDPAAGSYYIEQLTLSLIEKSWELLLEVDENGGYFACLEKGFIQSKIAEMAQKRDINLANRKEILLGTNQYPNSSETMLDKITIEKTTIEEHTTIKPLKLYRGAEAFESLRLETEKAAKTPSVFMFTYGNLAQRRGRSQFAGNFFACAGYEIVDNNGFKTVEEGIQKAQKVKADVIVVCSSDDEYINIVPQIYETLGQDAIIVVAGHPTESIDQLKSIGIEFFIHVKSNVLETLKAFNKKLIR